MCFMRKKGLPEHTLNIWNRHDFAMAGLGEKSKIIAMFKHFRKCLKWSRQRVVRGMLIVMSGVCFRICRT